MSNVRNISFTVCLPDYFDIYITFVCIYVHVVGIYHSLLLYILFTHIPSSSSSLQLIELDTTLHEMVGNLRARPIVDALAAGVLPTNKEEGQNYNPIDNDQVVVLNVLDGSELFEEVSRRDISLQELIKEKRFREYKLNKLGNKKKVPKIKSKRKTTKKRKSDSEL